MKIEAEKMSEHVATEELVRELVRNDARRGEYMMARRVHDHDGRRRRGALRSDRLRL